MKANELRIGNYVCVTEKHPLKVKIINDSDGIMSTVSDNSIFITTASLLAYKPIPLTEEWLLKFGFEEAGDKFYEKGLLFTNCWFLYFNITCKGKVTLSTDSEEYYLTDVPNVHQLQNLYHALTGEELTIKQNDEK